EKHAGQNGREASGKKVNDFFTTGLLLLRLLKNDCFVLSAGHEFR
ncbi:alternative ribosome-rescue factor A, partial [Klebsiella michiganensis]